MRTQITEGGFDGELFNVIEVVDNPPAVPYIIYQDMNYRFFSIPLSGQFAGVKVNATRNMTVEEDYGDGPPKTIPNGRNNGRSDSGSGSDKSSSTGGIAGGVCAAVVVIMAALGFLYYRRRHSSRRELNNHQDIGKIEIESSDPSSPTASATVAGPPHLTQSLSQEPMQHIVRPPPLQYPQVHDQGHHSTTTTQQWS
jgi:hypothetical protein